MYKIRKVKFKNHKVLGNLELDFCGIDGKAVDTVIIAGENGTGKSTILESLYCFVSKSINMNFDMDIIIESSQDEIVSLSFYQKEEDNGIYTYVTINGGRENYIGSSFYTNKFKFQGIFSDVDINFHTQNISSTTSMSLDSLNTSRRSDNNFPNQIKQLIIDIQSLDDSDIAKEVKADLEKGKSITELKTECRMPRFTKAFNNMFDDLEYDRVDNINNTKYILFKKNGINISLDELSSGEKQIVYRGCFLLKDINAITGAFVFIDEPEISLHPLWQKKVMNFYKDIFTDNNGNQTSQIFAVTHSPFVIHNENRKNDKVIVLGRNDNGDIIVKDKPSYYKCNSIDVIEDAFYINDYSEDKSFVYLEGQTDEKYFKKATEIFSYNNLPFEFKWIGYLDENNQEKFTGKNSLDKAMDFLIQKNSNTKNVCLYDSDTNKDEYEKNNVYCRIIKRFDNSKGIQCGIENTFILDSIELQDFYSVKEKTGPYGEKKHNEEFKKMEFCHYVCDSLGLEQQKIVLANLKDIIDNLIKIFD